jgi:hypothetical protein
VERQPTRVCERGDCAHRRLCLGRGATCAEDDEFDESMGYSGGGGGRVGGGDAGMEQTLGYGKFQPVQHGQGGGYGRDDQDMMLMDFSMGQTAMHSQVRTLFRSLVMRTPRAPVAPRMHYERDGPTHTHIPDRGVGEPHPLGWEHPTWLFLSRRSSRTGSGGERTPCGVCPPALLV